MCEPSKTLVIVASVVERRIVYHVVQLRHSHLQRPKCRTDQVRRKPRRPPCFRPSSKPFRTSSINLYETLQAQATYVVSLSYHSQDNGPYGLYIDLKAGEDNQERIEHQRTPRSTTRTSNRKRKASAMRNGTLDSVQPARKRARTSLQSDHYYYEIPDNGDTHEHLSGTLPCHLARTTRITTWKTRIYRRAYYRLTLYKLYRSLFPRAHRLAC